MSNMRTNKADPRVIVAMDLADEKALYHLIDRLEPAQCKLKVGKELFTALGPRIVTVMVKRGFEVFLDLKYHDIPNTVAKACHAAADLGVWMINIHAQGGRRMMEAAAEALARRNNKPLLIAVTVLTSLTQEDLRETGIPGSVEDYAVKLAGLARQSGLDGIVSSALEITRMRQHYGHQFILVTPGIRPSGAVLDDQRRILTPVQAVQAGADYLVIGRPITQAEDPIRQLLTINSELISIPRTI